LRLKPGQRSCRRRRHSTVGTELVDRHRSKSVDLFRQGRINFILNSALDSAAAEHFQLHVPSACAMALRVDDARGAMQRARVLLCPDWQERIGEGERRIPALRGPDGTLIYPVQPSASGRTINDDDVRLFADPSTETLLTDIDYVAEALPVGRMDNFVLFHRALMGFMPG
jgi:4-hydroxyphenylpyruvate dioxygenase